jgi:acetyl-CoA carboxylase biotin carboxyl carrier protein
MKFDITERDISAIVHAVQQSDVTRFRLVTPDCEIYISRADDDGEYDSKSSVWSSSTPSVVPVVAPNADVAASTTAPPPAAGAPDTVSADLRSVTSPMIGIFYTAPEPGADPFVSVGGLVERDATVGLVEAMKLFTAVEAGVHGTVEEVLVSNGDYVEFGQPLMRVRPAEHGG